MKDVIFKLLKKELFNIDVDQLNDVVWEDVWSETRLQAVGTLVYSGAKKCGIEFDEQTQKKAANQLTRISRAFKCHRYIGEMLEKANIPYVIIKGAVSSHYYPHSYVRPMGDTDVLVKKNDIQRTVELFKSNGLVTDKENINLDIGHHIDFRFVNQRVELHYELPGIPDNNMHQQVLAITKDIFEKAIDYETIHGAIKGASEFHHGIIMLLHMQEHMQRGGMGLRHLCDWAVFVNSFTEEKFRLLFEEKLKAIGLWHFACLMCQVSSYIGLPQKEWMGKDEKLAKLLIDDILAGGNFGIKDISRGESSRYVPKVQDGKRNKSQLAQYFTYGVKATAQIWPIYKKHKWLMPIGFIGYCFFTAYKIITGKSKFYDLSKDSQRYDIYAQLKLFEK